MRINTNNMKEETIDQVADFLFNRLERCSLDEAVTYLYEEFGLKEECDLPLSLDQFFLHSSDQSHCA